MKRDTRKAYRARTAAAERWIEEGLAERRAAAAERHSRAQKKHAAENTPVPFTDEQWTAARHVRDRAGWHQAVRVNTKSVTVATGYSWTDRILRSKVLEVR